MAPPVLLSDGSEGRGGACGDYADALHRSFFNDLPSRRGKMCGMVRYALLHGTQSIVFLSQNHRALAMHSAGDGHLCLPHLCTSRWPQEPLVACVSNGSECQAVARTSEAHPLTSPITPNARNHMPYTTYSPSPLPTAYHHRTPWTCALGGRPVAGMGHGHL